jgi:ribosomal protein L12E/L44/L45/RPP1/RPP2
MRCGHFRINECGKTRFWFLALLSARLDASKVETQLKRLQEKQINLILLQRQREAAAAKPEKNTQARQRSRSSSSSSRKKKHASQATQQEQQQQQPEMKHSSQAKPHGQRIISFCLPFPVALPPDRRRHFCVSRVENFKEATSSLLASKKTCDKIRTGTCDKIRTGLATKFALGLAKKIQSPQKASQLSQWQQRWSMKKGPGNRRCQPRTQEGVAHRSQVKDAFTYFPN